MKRYSETVYLDANFFIFSLLDRTEVGEGARMIYQKMVEGKLNTATSSLTFDEVMWVLIKANKKHLIKDAVNDIYKTQNLAILPVSISIPLNAIDLILKGLNPRDAFHVAVMMENKISTIISDDLHFKAVEDIKCFNFKDFLLEIEG
ncbi:MAG: type II toxin-antitoxin system VapC family toxin [Methanocellales archaeon]|nr:type II toxin-antitoxin system VapC family toxin [Methanocellales archaeon]MDI6902730.1 type II toxin-antitoxin system VapC family toxin [Methanocellales archaeon]